MECTEHARLTWALLTWIIHYGDLINISKLKRCLAGKNSALLGAILSIALKNKATPKLFQILKNCKKNKKHQVLFGNMQRMKVTSLYENHLINIEPYANVKIVSLSNQMVNFLYALSV